jgi:hypothetical protein
MIFSAGSGRRSVFQLVAFVYDGGIRTRGLFTVASESAIEALKLAKSHAERLDRIEAGLGLNVPDFTKDA